MSNISVLKTDNTLLIEGAKEILAVAMDMDFEAVVVVGIVGSRVWMKKSRVGNTLELVGALESAKFDVLKNWGE